MIVEVMGEGGPPLVREGIKRGRVIVEEVLGLEEVGVITLGEEILAEGIEEGNYFYY